MGALKRFHVKITPDKMTRIPPYKLRIRFATEVRVGILQKFAMQMNFLLLLFNVIFSRYLFAKEELTLKIARSL